MGSFGPRGRSCGQRSFLEGKGGVEGGPGQTQGNLFVLFLLLLLCVYKFLTIVVNPPTD